jgi:hypothetical protein
VYRVLVGKPEGKRPLGRPKRKWEDNITMYLKEVGCGVWTGLSWLRIEAYTLGYIPRQLSTVDRSQSAYAQNTDVA